MKAQLDRVEGQINKLQQEKYVILQELNECVDTSLTQRYYLWSANADVHLENFRELEDECPILAEHISNEEFNRHQTYDLTDDTYFVEALDPIFSATDEERLELMKTMPDYELWFTIGMEVMRRNLKTFEYDW